jgi:hypothetical protein
MINPLQTAFPKIFISYAWENQATARQLYGALYIGSLFEKAQLWFWTLDMLSADVAWGTSFYVGSCNGFDVANLGIVRAVR